MRAAGAVFELPFQAPQSKGGAAVPRAIRSLDRSSRFVYAFIVIGELEQGWNVVWEKDVNAFKVAVG